MFSNKTSHPLRRSKVDEKSNAKHYSSRNDTANNACNDTVFQQTNLVIFRPFFAVFCLFLHGTFNQLLSVIVKKVPYMNPLQLCLIRNFVIFAAALPLAIYHTKQILGENKDKALIFLSGFAAATGIYFQIIACRYLPLAEATIIMSTVPLVVTIMARILLKEPFGLFHGVSLVSTISGVLLVLRVPEMLLNRNGIHFDLLQVAGLLAAVGSVLLHSLSDVYLRKLREVHFSIMMLYAGAIGIIENSVLGGIFITFELPNCDWDQILCICFGSFSFISTCFIILAIQVEPVGLVAVQKSSFDILIIIVFQIIFFNIYPNLYAICGVCLVVASLTMVGMKN